MAEAHAIMPSFSQRPCDSGAELAANSLRIRRGALGDAHDDVVSGLAVPRVSESDEGVLQGERGGKAVMSLP